MRHSQRTLLVRRLVLTTAVQSQGYRCDTCWGSGTSGPRQPGEPRWLGQPAWLAPHCEFAYSGRILTLRKRGGKGLVVGWITERWPLGTTQPSSYAQRSARLPGATAGQ